MIDWLWCRFVRSEEDDSNDSWEVRMARRYYAKLFKEYAIADLSRYKVCCKFRVSGCRILLFFLQCMYFVSDVVF